MIYYFLKRDDRCMDEWMEGWMVGEYKQEQNMNISFTSVSLRCKRKKEPPGTTCFMSKMNLCCLLICVSPHAGKGS